MTMALVRSGVPARGRRGGWLLIAAQCGYPVGFAVCVYLALARAAQFAGHWYVPAANDSFTANADIMAGWAWGTLVTLMVPSAVIVSLPALLISTVLFLSGYTRGRRALTIALAGSTAAMLLTLVAALTPAVQSISGWLVD